MDGQYVAPFRSSGSPMYHSGCGATRSATGFGSGQPLEELDDWPASPASLDELELDLEELLELEERLELDFELVERLEVDEAT